MNQQRHPTNSSIIIIFLSPQHIGCSRNQRLITHYGSNLTLILNYSPSCGERGRKLHYFFICTMCCFHLKSKAKKAVTLAKYTCLENKNQRKQLFMSIITITFMESNKRIRINFGSLTPQSPPEPQGFIFLSKSKYFYVVIR